MKATKVTAGPAERKGSLLPGLWRDSLHVTCGLTAVHRDQLRAQRSVTSMGKLYLLYFSWTGVTHTTLVEASCECPRGLRSICSLVWHAGNRWSVSAGNDFHFYCMLICLTSRTTCAPRLDAAFGWLSLSGQACKWVVSGFDSSILHVCGFDADTVTGRQRDRKSVRIS